MTAMRQLSSSPRRYATRNFAVNFGTHVEVVESGPSIAARLLTAASRLMVRPILTVGSYAPLLPWPWGLIDAASRIRRVPAGAAEATIALPNATAQLVRAPGVLPADGTRRVVLFLHGGSFLFGGANSHSRMVNALSTFADSPLLVVNYRLMPKHTIGMAIDDCHDAYQWLRLQGYQPDQVVLAGDSAGGYLALALAQRLRNMDETPAALVAISPLIQLGHTPKQSHPNMKTDAIFSAKSFDAFAALLASVAAKHQVDDSPEAPYEPLDHIEAGLPRTLIHVSGSEVLLHDAQLAAAKLAAAGVPTELRVWPGQIHDFQAITPMVPEATRSLRQIGEYIREATG
ncbi:alpha/beta hydrolase fold domain-containing protein [Mycobacterium angelicum]|uniref:Esterase n=1 Tax=Mycobacterium angelicum TaxID=470074 RepID=A0A1W9ZMS5_MYCAN|nr:alpha/beta hydrolase [Mycobacterium angelicum]MCV7200082.1 alpha/beta hydrolase [Mycobacterium angelicum]ORA19114.1 esterase [Mycobacterium angelicum]